MSSLTDWLKNFFTNQRFGGLPTGHLTVAPAPVEGHLTTDRDDPRLRQVDPRTGLQGAYVVLSEGERAKGYVRPVRTRYKHLGPEGPKYPLRDLTAEEVSRFADYDYAKFEEYPESEDPIITGRYWKQAELDRRGCGMVTIMSQAIAETYARNPGFYGGTYCAGCGEHFPVGERGEFVWCHDDGTPTSIKVGT